MCRTKTTKTNLRRHETNLRVLYFTVLDRKCNDEIVELKNLPSQYHAHRAEELQWPAGKEHPEQVQS